jgi:hypothetical protein
MFPLKQRQISSARTVGFGVADWLLTSEIIEPKFNVHTYDRIDILNFADSDDSGYYITNNFIELVPTNKSYNLLDINGKCKKIFVNGDALCSTERKKIIENTIRVVLTELNFASESSRVNILNDGTLLVSSDDWSYCA